MVALGGISIGAGIVGGILAPTVLLDIVSFWPLAAIPLIAGIVLWRRRSSKLGAVPPLLLLSFVMLVVVLHLIGWSKLPSAAGDLIGPSAADVSEVSMTVSLPGALAIREGDGPLYVVRLARSGGSLGVPEALESSVDGTMDVDIHQRDGGRWFRTNAWSAVLNGGPMWTLDLSSPSLDVDLNGLNVGSAMVDGGGSVVAGASTSTISVTGSFTIEVPSGAKVEVYGSADVPGSWASTDDGFQSPGQGSSIVIDVTEGSHVVIKER
jgi:hypothetical protein